MSYCRWSSDNWKSDVYCYEHVDGGYTTHVAGARLVGDVPANPILTLEYLKMAQREAIGLPHDGKNFHDRTLEEFRQRLKMLRDVGYHVPEHVFEDIDNELAAS